MCILVEHENCRRESKGCIFKDWIENPLKMHFFLNLPNLSKYKFQFLLNFELKFSHKNFLKNFNSDFLKVHKKIRPKTPVKIALKKKQL